MQWMRVRIIKKKKKFKKNDIILKVNISLFKIMLTNMHVNQCDIVNLECLKNKYILMVWTRSSMDECSQECVHKRNERQKMIGCLMRRSV